ncbi:MAG: hypothetical protein H3C55_11805 [Pseudorhodoplanes sp.]|nr:hypothetical protein [Pseudorhodoplanes sp.]
MTTAPSTIRVVIPLKVKHRNGRPRIVPPDDVELEPPSQEPHLLRAIARAWRWRRQLESGDVATIQDIADAEKVSDRFVGRMLRLAYLSPLVLERLLLYRKASAVSIKELAAAAELAWAEQENIVVDG